MAHPSSAPKTGPLSVPDHWWSEAWAVFVKDIRSELRTRAALSTILLFSLVVLLITAFLMTTHGYGLDRVLRPVEEIRRIAAENPTFKETDITQAYPGTSFARASILSALLWITLFFSAMAGLPRAFVKEEEMRTAAALRLAARPSAVLAGKLVFNAALMLTVSVVLLLPFLFLYEPVIANWPLFLATLPAGALSMAGAATIVGAMVARAGGKTYLMVALSFPILLPVFIFAINTSTAGIAGKGSNQLVPLVSYLVLMVTASAFLFEAVWND